MSPGSWQAMEVGDQEVATGSDVGPLVSLRFITAAIRRRWRLWAALAVLGAVIGAVVAFALPPKRTATVTLMLAHQQGTDPAADMATDVALAGTRSIATTVVDELGLSMTAADFIASTTITPVTSDLLELTVSAPTADEAVARTAAFAKAYLDFRTTRLQATTTALVNADQERITQLQSQSDQLTTQYGKVSGSTSTTDQALAAGLLTQRAQLDANIASLKQQIADAQVQSDTVTKASSVIDAAAVVKVSALKTALLAVGSGVLGGAFLGMGWIAVAALMSDRLRLRREIAMALGLPVRWSVGRLPRPRTLTSSRLRRGSRRRARAEALAQLLESALVPVERPGSAGPAGEDHRRFGLTLAGIDNPADICVAAAALGARLARQELTVGYVDLTRAGRLRTILVRAGRDRQVTVFRPTGAPALASGTPEGPTSSDPTGPVGVLPPTDVVLVVAEVDLAMGVQALPSWGPEVALLVTSGRSNAERLHSAAQLLRDEGIAPRLVAVLGADDRDATLGTDISDEESQSSADGVRTAS